MLGVKSSSPILQIKINSQLSKVNFVSRKTVSSSSKTILAPNNIFFKHLLNNLTIPSNIPPHQVERGGLNVILNVMPF